MASGYIILKKEFLPPNLDETGDFEIPGAFDYYNSVVNSKKIILFPVLENSVGGAIVSISPGTSITVTHDTKVSGGTEGSIDIVLSIPLYPDTSIAVSSKTPNIVSITEI